MKCPKCGFNSFECASVCKKCSQDLSVFKETHGLKPIVLQMETRSAMVAAMNAETPQNAAAQQPEEQPSDMFSFDIPDVETTTPEPKKKAGDDFFSFTDKPAAAPADGFGDFSFDDDQVIKKPATMDDAFASLLESTPRGTAAAQASTSPVTPPSAAAGGADEFDLNSFSWDEPPETTPAGEKKTVDDFDSLFGDITPGAKK